MRLNLGGQPGGKAAVAQLLSSLSSIFMDIGLTKTEIAFYFSNISRTSRR